MGTGKNAIAAILVVLSANALSCDSNSTDFGDAGKANTTGKASNGTTGDGSSGEGGSGGRIDGSALSNEPRYFETLPPGSPLPSDEDCKASIKSRPENKGVNATFNATRGAQTLANNFLSGDPRANSELTVRVTGNFTGTTDEILQWVACKWGVDEDLVRSQASVESSWVQSAKGDWTSDSSHCSPGHGLGVDSRPGECPESWGILQNRYPYEMSSWPGIADSTAFNADTAYAIWRACYEGYETWLNDVEQGEPYAAGDALGCMGRWFAGRWHTDAANGYVERVQENLAARIWEKPEFQAP